MLVHLFSSELTKSVCQLDVLLSLELLSQVSSGWHGFHSYFTSDIGMCDMKCFKALT